MDDKDAGLLTTHALYFTRNMETREIIPMLMAVKVLDDGHQIALDVT
jgi:hypothetical protein